MAVSVSRLRAAGLAKEVTAGTPIVNPTRYLNILPPDGFTPMIEPLPSKGIEALINMYPKITQGPGTLNGMKIKMEVEPENIGEILNACFGLDTKTGSNPYTHTFKRAAVSALPTYTWWFDKTLKFPLFAGSMLDKLELDLKSKGIMEASADFVGTVYDNTDGTSEATSFSVLQPFVWSNAVVTIDSVVKPGYDNLKLMLSNSVKADHALNNSIWPYVAYSEGFTPELSLDLFFEDTTQYAKFLAGSTAHVNIALTSVQSAVTYSLTIDIPSWYYKSANLYIPSSGPLKIPFSGLCQYNFGSGYDVQIALVNTISTAY